MRVLPHRLRILSFATGILQKKMMANLENHFGDDASFDDIDEILGFCCATQAKIIAINLGQICRVKIAMKWRLAIGYFFKMLTKMCHNRF